MLTFLLRSVNLVISPDSSYTVAVITLTLTCCNAAYNSSRAKSSNYSVDLAILNNPANSVKEAH